MSELQNQIDKLREKLEKTEDDYENALTEHERHIAEDLLEPQLNELKEAMEKQKKFYDVAERTEGSGTDWLWRVQIIDRIIDTENNNKLNKEVLQDLNDKLHNKGIIDIGDYITNKEKLKDHKTEKKECKDGEHILQNIFSEKLKIVLIEII